MDGELAGTPFRPLRLHRIYRLMVRRDGPRIRWLHTHGYDLADRFPAIVDAALRLKAQSFPTARQ
jgi:hypothetical protein